MLNRIVRWHPRKGIAHEAGPRHAEIIIHDQHRLRRKRETGGEETRLERAQTEWKGGKQDGQRQGRCADCRQDDKIQENCRTDKLLGTRQNGHRVRYEGSHEANDGPHLRRLEQTRQAGKIRGVHRLRLGRVPKVKKINVRRMHPQRAAHAQVLEQDAGRSGSEFSRSRICCSEGESSSSRDDVVVEGQGETTRGHVMGDASAVIGIMRRMELGKVSLLNTSW